MLSLDPTLQNSQPHQYHPDFASQTPMSRVKRKVIAIPKALWVGVIKTVYHFASAWLMGRLLSNDKAYFKMHCNIAKQDIAEGYGWLVLLVNDKQGLKLISQAKLINLDTDAALDKAVTPRRQDIAEGACPGLAPSAQPTALLINLDTCKALDKAVTPRRQDIAEGACPGPAASAQFTPISTKPKQSFVSALFQRVVKEGRHPMRTPAPTPFKPAIPKTTGKNASFAKYLEEVRARNEL